MHFGGIQCILDSIVVYARSSMARSLSVTFDGENIAIAKISNQVRSFICGTYNRIGDVQLRIAESVSFVPGDYIINNKRTVASYVAAVFRSQ